ncbi:ABC-type uncharacterized transport system permease subunit [Arenicella xantha]|uniref:ABC-type uncharacterized transport system permease subunit n=2 Tax=Arenicella xantha TaxID=644221 RepID=A0A395JGX2_9GAMM|nr:ABC-type uncharacterized transport system permease subunit [Arenicella xantha]
MYSSWLIYVAIAFYSVATLLIASHIRTTRPLPAQDSSTGRIRAAFALALVACALHAAAAFQVGYQSGSLNVSLHSMTLVVSAFVVSIFILGGLALPIRRLGVLVFPLTILCLVFALLWDEAPSAIASRGKAFTLHILISISAYALLAIASVQALLYAYQERQIKHRANPAMLMALPPLQTMEILWFRLVAMGFALLTLTLASGVFFSQQIFGYAFAFKHHTVFAYLGWIVFAILLYKRLRFGLRGAQAVTWTMGGFLLIQIGYFGTKIVSELLAVQ